MSCPEIAEDGFVDVIDWDHLFDDPNPFIESASGSSDNPSPDSVPFSIDEVEQLLMNDDVFVGDDVVGVGEEDLANGFLSDILLDSPAESDRSVQFIDVPGEEEKDTSSEEEKHKEEEIPCAGVSQSEQERDDRVDDPIAKKRKRQLRNRDAAVRSRERKKVYVRDLELKSKYFEAECRRLGMVLQCCLAENQALRLSLMNGKASGAPMTKQESAVLLLESLLLGSLLWFLGIVCLFSLPKEVTPEESPQENLDNTSRGSLALGKLESEVDGVMIAQSVMMGKKFKASRSRMKGTTVFLIDVRSEESLVLVFW